MRMDRYEDENKGNEEKATRLNKNQELYTDVYLNNVYVDIDNLKNFVSDNEEEEKEEVRKVREIDLNDHNTYEEKEYDIVKLVNEAINNKEETKKGSFDFQSNEEEIKNVIDSINEKTLEENKEKEARREENLLADLMPTSENTDILPALEPLPDTTNVILQAPITDTSILELPDEETEEVSLDMLGNDITDEDMEDDSFREAPSKKYVKLIIILVVVLIIGIGVLILKLLDVF